jgi:hypothetical protein
MGQTNQPGASKLGKTHPSASSSRPNPPAVAKEVAEKPQSSEKGKASQKPNPEEKKKGTLDWSKAKEKEEQKRGPMSATKVVVKKESKSAIKQKVEKLQPEPKKDEDTKAKAKKEPTEAAMVSTKKTVESDRPKVSWTFHAVNQYVRLICSSEARHQETIRGHVPI